MSIERTWHPKFIEYMKFIVSHPNYKGLAINFSDDSYNWITTKKSELGKQRLKWANEKAKQLGIKEEPGYLRKVMYAVHPTKMKVCQICGKTLSLNYIYLNRSFISAIYKNFGCEFTELNSIYDVVHLLKENGYDDNKINDFLIKSFKLNNKSTNNTKIIIKKCIEKCIDGSSKYLGPGAMSNFPDRFDGFHSYNRCCRSKEDTGRSKENLRTYNKDRRAYEYWSDGNLYAANKFMHSSFFSGTSADHVGPLSLGFIHDPRQLRKLNKKDNSAKRDRLLYKDIKELQNIEDINNICVISWYSDLIWDFIKKNLDKTSDLENFRKLLKINLQYYMELLWNIINICGKKGEIFLIRNFLEPKYSDFKYEYTFNELGQITSKTPRRETDDSRKEFDRFVRISFVSVLEFHEKENRKTNIHFSKEEKDKIQYICKLIDNDSDNKIIVDMIKEFVVSIEKNLIENKE